MKHLLWWPCRVRYEKHCLQDKYYGTRRVNPPSFLVHQMPGLLKRYSGCRGLVRHMPLLEQTRFGCHELKSKNDFRTKTVELHQIIF